MSTETQFIVILTLIGLPIYRTQINDATAPSRALFTHGEVWTMQNDKAVSTKLALEAKAKALNRTNDYLREDIACLKQLIEVLVASKQHAGVAVLGMIAYGG